MKTVRLVDYIHTDIGSVKFYTPMYGIVGMIKLWCNEHNIQLDDYVLKVSETEDPYIAFKNDEDATLFCIMKSHLIK